MESQGPRRAVRPVTGSLTAPWSSQWASLVGSSPGSPEESAVSFRARVSVSTSPLTHSPPHPFTSGDSEARSSPNPAGVYRGPIHRGNLDPCAKSHTSNHCLPTPKATCKLDSDKVSVAQGGDPAARSVVRAGHNLCWLRIPTRENRNWMLRARETLLSSRKPTDWCWKHKFGFSWTLNCQVAGQEKSVRWLM